MKTGNEAENMRKAVTVLVVSTMLVSGCASVRDSRFNPFNWFGQSRSEPVASDEATNPLIPRRRASIFFNNQPESYRGRMVADVTELLVERRPGGAIIRVRGVADRIGPFDVRLTREEEESDASTLTFALRALQQAGPRNVGARAREVTAALWVTDQNLAGIRTIRVLGQNNARSVRR